MQTQSLDANQGVPAGAVSPEAPACFHCGTLCRGSIFQRNEKPFCCAGCLTVFELLTENGLSDFYQLGQSAGTRINPAPAGQFHYLDEPAVRERLVDFANDRLTRVTLHLPAIHCIACVWLLENLFRLNPGIGQSQVNFPRKEVAISFDNSQTKLSEVVSLLASLGYEPELRFSDLDTKPKRFASRRLWLQLGIAGFAFGNTMLFCIAHYLGLDTFSGPAFQKLVGLLSLGLAIPVVAYSAADYWRSAWVSLRQRLLNIDVPIAAGIAALFAQSTYEVVSGHGVGYFDSLAGLLFFLLCGKLFQQKTYDRLAFDRDYKSFFPLSVMRKTVRNEERVALAQLHLGDRLILRNGELIPADARLVEGPAVIDYSFVTGESEPVEKRAGDYLYSGGRQIGGAIEVETVKAVSQSYLTSLWNQEAFRKDEGARLNQLTNRYSQRFTKMVIAIALGAAVFWAWANPALSVKAFTSVLIVACPCALALAAPFALGTAQRVLARQNIFLKNPYVTETLADVDAVVFDKTGTLTAASAGSVTFHGAPLSETEERWLYSMTRHSTHPLPVRIGEAIARAHFPEPVCSFLETPGCGMEGSVAGHEIWMGSVAWLEGRGARPIGALRAEGGSPSPRPSPPGEGGTLPARGHLDADGLNGNPVCGSGVHVAIDGRYRGCYVLASALRPEADALITNLSPEYDLALLSGDNEKERHRFAHLFGADLHFNQSPLNKLAFIRQLQGAGKTVMMVGDGLNDAGALKQSDVGVAVVENIHAFSPASDVIMAAPMVPRLNDVLRFAKQSVRVVRASFLISLAYNVVGIAIAASGHLSPIVCAILMPVSSVTVVGFACGLTIWLGRRQGLGEPATQNNRAELEFGAPAEALT
ncbi:MAG: heavy metal translocating P-type ATPase metal-binding domain-containing protein [Verrucomicrobiota bacterium]